MKITDEEYQILMEMVKGERTMTSEEWEEFTTRIEVREGGNK